MARGRRPWLQPAVVAGALAPLGHIAWRAATGALGAEPIATVLNQLGLLALLLLLASLACTPLKLLWGWNWPIGLRRTLGLLGFFYVCLHLVTYAAVDQGLDLAAISEDILKRPFIFVGFAAFVLLIPLAATSTSKMLKRLGFARWKRLHRLAYVIGILGVVHYFLRVKKDVTEPVIYAAVLFLLLAIRLGSHLAESRRTALRRGTRPAAPAPRRPADPG